MYTIADTEILLEEGVISQTAARIIEARARSTMVTLAINAVLCTGIVFATFGLIFWLADAMLVAVSGILLAGAGLLTLRQGPALYAMFGNAASLIGAGMLIGGAGFELAGNFESIAGPVMAIAGAVVAVPVAWAMHHNRLTTRFVTGAVTLMALALHLTGVGYLVHESGASGLPVAAFWLYAAAAIAGAGWFTDVRLVSALAIVPFAQALDTGTFYFHAAYVFYSPEPTLSIMQMCALVVLMVLVARRTPERTARHARIHLIMAFIVASLCALVGSLWGDVVGETIWGPGSAMHRSGLSYEDWRDSLAAFRDTALTVHENVFTIVWALSLAGIIFWSAHKNMRGIFNAAVTFAAIHAYTQAFETFYDEPLAYAAGGFAAIPLAWGMWRLNTWFLARQPAET
ncbi:hypothetical protein [Roseobacter ponti]|uniref:DUF2157 domain-containing protein n=1 Tax=Roseobacter ponti TaxID=1891787 RepID=A0A858SZ69_9RHOB|nr:hypothetical protein [Roseobacter ponti]QJF52156.1 hypothetical protein G3256_13740 [Roseobacter ponti]